jgi:hypothetical protein
MSFSGPFPKYDVDRGIYVQVFTARPVPAGMTVIATPARPGGQYQFNPQASPFIPKDPEPAEAEKQEDRECHTPSSINTAAEQVSPSCPPSPGTSPQQTPCFMYWSAKFPQGRMVPMRQPVPPVYFHTGQNKTDENGKKLQEDGAFVMKSHN